MKPVGVARSLWQQRAGLFEDLTVLISQVKSRFCLGRNHLVLAVPMLRVFIPEQREVGSVKVWRLAL